MVRAKKSMTSFNSCQPYLNVACNLCAPSKQLQHPLLCICASVSAMALLFSLKIVRKILAAILTEVSKKKGRHSLWLGSNTICKTLQTTNRVSWCNFWRSSPKTIWPTSCFEGDSLWITTEMDIIATMHPLKFSLKLQRQVEITSDDDFDFLPRCIDSSFH